MSRMFEEVAKALRKRAKMIKKPDISSITSKSMKMKTLVVLNILKNEIILIQMMKLIRALLAASAYRSVQ